ncbi:bacterial alpha-L-rhamnosidase domain-containing protein [Colletotrichum scovillei]|uniref:bacterial alpha-L-rhamnosidase domain-containing protein n=1 Tax=Colletotrichum scovillei TaxID=1209932 RepID=UPI0015C33B51|nr:bacterial alpha-L-rhamnosidase domain-containing protein [Colletotrichum scovillei]KAF4785651.1 bacterial alpha-L-rhamnosidase domain-containing protein [Colletotrichum scovillei]
MRRTWGYMLDSPLMTGTTLVEGMSANGSLYYRSQRGYNYDAAYTSLSHSWSTGPTQALSFKVVGLEVVGWGRWRFEPQMGDLRRAEAGWRDGKGGEYGAVVVVEGGGGDDGQGEDGVLEAEILTPNGTEGVLEIPYCEVLLVDGEKWDGGRLQGGRTKNMTVGSHSC